MGIACALLLRGALWQQAGQAGVKAAMMAGTIAIGVMLYALLSWIMKSEELSFTIRLLLRRTSRS